MRVVPSALSLLATLLVSNPVFATVTEPNGTVVPRDSMNGEVQIYTMFMQRNDPVDWLMDAAATPAVFSPLCDFRATLVLRQTASNYAVGWYNAGGAPPMPTDIHVIVPVGSPVGSTINGADIRSDPAYAGGAVGFALVGGQTHYSETALNPVCTGCTPSAPWQMAVIYRSIATPNAYYVGFEDGSVGATPNSYNNDGDYNDYVYLFEGLSCMGGGQPCDTGMQGICAQGLTECGASGIVCRVQTTPTSERCNGLDDNCDGTVDEGNNLCTRGNVCDRGVCVPMCVEGSCFSGQTCSSRGTCVETACQSVTCPTGQICTGGACHGACDGVTCPGDQVCRGGRCADPCAGVTCLGGDVCSGGVCIHGCNCAPCSSTTGCDTNSLLCVDPGCVGMTCAAGMICRSGSCIDSCAAAVCPTGQQCSAGQCTDASPDAGVVSDGGNNHDGGLADAHVGDGSSIHDGSSGDGFADGASSVDGNHDGSVGDGGHGSGSGGCHCSIALGSSSTSHLGWLSALSLLVLIKRRKSRAER